MIRLIIAVIALTSFANAALAQAGTSANKTVQTSGANPATQAASSNKAPANTKSTSEASKTGGEVEKLKAAPAKKQSLKAAVNQAIKVFVPTEKIDVDKPVDFPTNI